jgi:hypothetical protein
VNEQISLSDKEQKKRKRTHDSSKLWHCRLGHISRERIENLVKNDILPPLELSDIEQCIDCIKENFVKQIKKGANQSTSILEIIHTDICGLFSVKSVDCYDSYITFTDDYSRYGYIYPIKETSEALDKFKIFKAEVENQHDKRIKIVCSDRGGGGVLRSAHFIWSSTWTFCKVLIGKWNSRLVFNAGRTSAKWSS